MTGPTKQVYVLSSKA